MYDRLEMNYVPYIRLLRVGYMHEIYIATFSKNLIVHSSVSSFFFSFSSTLPSVSLLSGGVVGNV